MVWGLLVGFLRGKEEEEKKKGGLGLGLRRWFVRKMQYLRLDG